jgi:hypothetical protein
MGRICNPICNGYGTDMGRIWDGYGTDMGRIWDGYGSDMGRICNGYGTDMGRIWDGYGTDMGRIWDGYGTDIGRIWDGYGTDMGRICFFYRVMLLAIFSALLGPNFCLSDTLIFRSRSIMFSTLLFPIIQGKNIEGEGDGAFEIIALATENDIPGIWQSIAADISSLRSSFLTVDFPMMAFGAHVPFT